MSDSMDAEEAYRRVGERPSVHDLSDGRRIDLSAPFVGNHVSVDAYTADEHPDDMGHRRSYNFVWDEPRVLRYTGTTVNHGGAPVKKEYPLPKHIRGLVLLFFAGRVDVVSDHGFNRAISRGSD